MANSLTVREARLSSTAQQTVNSEGQTSSLMYKCSTCRALLRHTEIIFGDTPHSRHRIMVARVLLRHELCAVFLRVAGLLLYLGGQKTQFHI